MDMYDFDLIKGSGNCLDMALELGLNPVSPGRFHSPFRSDSDSGSFAINEDGWFDHVTHERGSIIDLVSRLMFNEDIMEAQNWLGERLGLTPSKVSRSDFNGEIDKIYQYFDLEGNLRHETVRYKPKDFRQRTPNGKGGHIWSLEGVKLFLYRLPEWINQPWVCICEGEKDVDNLWSMGIPATCNPAGAGKWSDHFNEWIKGKNVVIFEDNDDSGRSHSRLISAEINEFAKAIKVICISDKEKGDVSNFIEDGGTYDDIMKIIADAKPIDLESRENALKAIAKSCNEKPYCNFTTKTVTGPDGKKKKGRIPKSIADLRSEVYKRFLNFPRMIGGILFDHDKETGLIRTFEKTHELFTWIGEKSEKSIIWARTEGMFFQQDVFNSLKSNARRYEAISSVPSYPIRDDVYYSHGKIPRPSEDGRYFNELCSFFNGETSVDDDLIKAAFATPLFYRRDSTRPVFIIGSNCGPGAGKTTLVSMIAKLYGGTYIGFTQKDFGGFAVDKLKKRFLSESGRKKRTCLVDNVIGHFESAEFSSLITDSDISGMAPYGRGEENRPNDLTFFMTANDATYDTDIITRAFFITLDKPIWSAGWSNKVARFIDENRMNIIADIIAIFNQNTEFEPLSRFADWEKTVLMNVCKERERHTDIFNAKASMSRGVNRDEIESEEIKESIATAISSVLVEYADENPVFFTADAIKSVISSGTKRLKGYVKSGLINEVDLSTNRIFLLDRKTRKRGVLWNPKRLEITGHNIIDLEISGRFQKLKKSGKIGGRA